MFYIVQSMNYCENKLFAGVSVDDVLDSSEYELSRGIIVLGHFNNYHEIQL
jgi:hypothetical protein